MIGRSRSEARPRFGDGGIHERGSKFNGRAQNLAESPWRDLLFESGVFQSAPGNDAAILAGDDVAVFRTQDAARRTSSASQRHHLPAHGMRGRIALNPANAS